MAFKLITLLHTCCWRYRLNIKPVRVYQAPDDAAHVLPSSDPTAHLLPNKIKDFTAFINLVDFCRYWSQRTWEPFKNGKVNSETSRHRLLLLHIKALYITFFKVLYKQNVILLIRLINWTYCVFYHIFNVGLTLFSYFCSELLLTKHLDYFQSWMYPLSHELILHSIRNPLVSGFYKLLSVTMNIAKRIKYYQVIFPTPFVVFTLSGHDLYCLCVYNVCDISPVSLFPIRELTREAPYHPRVTRWRALVSLSSLSLEKR